MRRSFALAAALGFIGVTACKDTVSPAEPNSDIQVVSASAFAQGGGSCTLASGKVVSTGFDQYGYNRCAHQFVGTFAGYCAQRSLPAGCAGVPGDTRLNMKWNEEWDRGNATGWSAGPYDAWLDNQISSKSYSEHFKTKWDAACVAGTSTGTCIWGQFLVLMDHGRDGGQHIWWTKNSPSGYGG